MTLVGVDLDISVSETSRCSGLRRISRSGHQMAHLTSVSNPSIFFSLVSHQYKSDYLKM